MKDQNTKELERHIFDKVTKEIEGIIKTEKDEIYAYSFFIYDAFSDPINASLTLGYNTMEHYRSVLESANDGKEPETLFDYITTPDDDMEAKWNYAFWLQNEIVEIGAANDSKGRELIKNWIEGIGLYYNKEESWKDRDTCMGKAREITQRFIQILVRVVRQIHQQYELNVPIIIHELTPYKGETEYNIQANGKELVKEYTDEINEYGGDLYAHIFYKLTRLSYIPEAEKEDIYAFSLFVNDDDPRHPTATLGYNTTSHFNSVKENAKTEQEAKWNLEFWLQDNQLKICTKNDIKAREPLNKYSKYKELYYTNEEYEKNKAGCLEKGKEITRFFINKLVSIIPNVQEFCNIDKPIIIHKSGYDKQVVALNVKANGEEKVKEFVVWIETV
ncbi:hypothetical protein OOZ15_08890 [Galbibacter sp. EGI 63066]|uniref:hypothetical protein n=1 Tax=Galbibacter sp. EGI 63066 TaxID=2993559 RepID=UPI0022495E36|nr:hypothetical protein [Galbibacter sp. EGI 63066]MCX2680051.1 hypothetical protein [Galbibacter sp. EGI 63066]